VPYKYNTTAGTRAFCGILHNPSEALGGVLESNLWVDFAKASEPPARAALGAGILRCRDAAGHRWRLGSAPRIDSTILKATARARRWFDDLMSGRAISMVEIGKREGVGKRYVSRLIRLAFLAPAIVESIAEGRQPPEFTAQFLSTRSWRSSAELVSPGTTARFRRFSLIAPPFTRPSPRVFCTSGPNSSCDRILAPLEIAEVHRQSARWRESERFAYPAIAQPFSGPLRQRKTPVNARI